MLGPQLGQERAQQILGQAISWSEEVLHRDAGGETKDAKQTVVKQEEGTVRNKGLPAACSQPEQNSTSAFT